MMAIDDIPGHKSASRKFVLTEPLPGSVAGNGAVATNLLASVRYTLGDTEGPIYQKLVFWNARTGLGTRE
jgi:hypothetical protein